MDTKSIVFVSLSSIFVLGLGSYYFMSDYQRKQAFNMDTYGNPKGDVELPSIRRPAGLDYGSTFGGKRTKNNRKRHGKKNSKKN
jgi:hypothetical protein